MKVTIVGQGYVGQSIAVAASESGHEVVGFDINADLISDLNEGNSFVPGIEKKVILDLIGKKNYIPTANPEFMEGSDVIVIAVPTPITINRKPDLGPLYSACSIIKRYVHGSVLIISESTSFPGTLRNIIKPSIESENEKNFSFAIAPERVDPGNPHWKISNTPRVISGLSDEATQKAVDFYSTFCSEIFPVSNPEIAESAKLLENTFRQVNIALINEFSDILDTLGISSYEVATAASTKPFGFMKFLPSIGVGGHCIPVDPEYFSFFASSVGKEAKITNLANVLNTERPKKVALKIKKLLGDNFVNSKIQVAGIAYKVGVSDLRESPAVLLINALRELGANVKWHDPVVKEWHVESSSPLDPNIDLGLIVTPHDCMDLNVWKSSTTRVLDLSASEHKFTWDKAL